MATRRSFDDEPDLPQTIPIGSEAMQSEKKGIRKKMLKRVSLNPFFLFPSFGSAGTAAWMAINGFTPWGLLATLGLLGVGGCSWLYTFIVNGPGYSREEGQKLLDKYLAAQEQELDDLAAACKKARFSDGLREVRSLETTYQNLRSSTLSENPEDTRLPGFLGLIEEAYEEGVGVLRQALTVHNNLSSFDAPGLKAEIKELEEELRELGPDQKAKRDLCDRKIKTRREKLQKYHDASDGLQSLLTRAGEIQATLEGSSLEMSDILNVDDTVATRETGAANRLAMAMSAAKEARELKNVSGRLDLNDIDRRLGTGRSHEEES